MNAGVPSRPLLRYLGSKWRLAPWIMAHMPPHDIYVEPFGGGASVLLRKPPCRTEVYNDLDQELVGLFRILRTAEAKDLIRQLELTPYARAEYCAALEPVGEPLERARQLIVRSHMGHGTRGTRVDRAAGFRSDGTSGTTRVAGEWADFPEVLRAIVERLRGVSIEQRPAIDLIDYWDSPETLFYLDPPYLPATRSAKAKQAEGYHVYAHEMTVAEHEELLERVQSIKGMVLISGYPSRLYDRHLAGWQRHKTSSRSHRNSPRTELLWLNDAAVAALPQRGLFAMPTAAAEEEQEAA